MHERRSSSAFAEFAECTDGASRAPSVPRRRWASLGSDTARRHRGRLERHVSPWRP
jgi:hypothetical protein